MAKKYGVGILGAGWVAGEYVKVFRDHPATEIVGVYSRTASKAAQLLHDDDVTGSVYASLDELLDDRRIDIVVSCTPHDVRAEQCIRAAQTGRHIVLEKPVGLTLDEVARIRDAVVTAGIKTVTSFILRWNPQFQTVKQLINDGVLGQLIYAEADYWHPFKKIYPGYPWYITKEQGGSSFVVAGCHAADILRFFGGDVVEVAAFSAPPKINHEIQYDPVAVGIVKFANGAVGKVSSIVDAETPYIFNCRLFGTEGTVQNNEVYSSKHYPGATGYWSFPTIKPDSGDVSHHPFKAEIEHFIECIEKNVEADTSIYDSYKSMAVTFAIDASAAKGGQPITVRND